MIKKELYVSPRNQSIEKAINGLSEQIKIPGFAIDHWEYRLEPGVEYHKLPQPWLATKAEQWNDFVHTLSENDKNFIGMGHERIVTRIPGQPNLVVSVFHEPKDWFYLQETLRVNHILNSLFPHNFPRIYGFFGCNDIYQEVEKPKGFFYTGFWTDYIEGIKPVKDCLREGFLDLYWKESEFTLEYLEKTKPQYPFVNTVAFMDEIGLPLRQLGLDPCANNFILTKNGEEFYVDTLNGPFQFGSKKTSFFYQWKSKQTVAALAKKVSEGKVNLSPSQFKFVRQEIELLGADL